VLPPDDTVVSSAPPEGPSSAEHCSAPLTVTEIILDLSESPEASVFLTLKSSIGIEPV